LKKRGISHLVLERNNEPGSFFNKFPIHRKLISINKKHNFFPEADFNLRHDWNSLLNFEEEDPLLFSTMTDDLFPSADLLCQYLSQVGQ
jgi:hypothetical protein